MSLLQRPTATRFSTGTSSFVMSMLLLLCGCCVMQMIASVEATNPNDLPIMDTFKIALNNMTTSICAWNGTDPCINGKIFAQEETEDDLPRDVTLDLIGFNLIVFFQTAPMNWKGVTCISGRVTQMYVYNISIIISLPFHSFR
jgi:hypothetical protein